MRRYTHQRNKELLMVVANKLQEICKDVTEALNPIELAEAYLKLSRDHQLSHDDIANMVGKSRAVVSNTIRLLNLPEHIKQYLITGQIEAGHARSLLMLDRATQEIIAQKIITEHLTVRDAEETIRYFQKGPGDLNTENHFLDHAKKLEAELSRVLNTIVSVKINQKGSGKISVSFSSLKNIEVFIDKIKERVG